MYLRRSLILCCGIGRGFAGTNLVPESSEFDVVRRMVDELDSDSVGPILTRLGQDDLLRIVDLMGNESGLEYTMSRAELQRGLAQWMGRSVFFFRSRRCGEMFPFAESARYS